MALINAAALLPLVLRLVVLFRFGYCRYAAIGGIAVQRWLFKLLTLPDAVNHLL